MKNIKKLLVFVLAIVVIILTNSTLYREAYKDYGEFELSFKVIDSKKDTIQVYYANTGAEAEWSEENSFKKENIAANKKVTVKQTLPVTTKYLRFDLGSQAAYFTVSDIQIKSKKCIMELDSDIVLKKSVHHDIDQMTYKNGSYYLKSTGSDPYFTYEIDDSLLKQISDEYKTERTVKIAFLCLLLDLVILYIARNARKVYSLLRKVLGNKRLIWNLSKNDFKTKYAGSYLGITWAFVQPIVTILVYWFVFEFGLRNTSPIPGVPYVLWFIAGLIPWFFFQEAINNGTNSLMEYSYLVKKVVFQIEILPVIKIISSLFVHLVFVAFMLSIFGIYGGFNPLYGVQCLYYMFCTIVLVLGLSYMTCSIFIFFKDLGQIISIILQILMWMTPILWQDTMLVGKLHLVADLNPIFYITEGYRDSLINQTWFWDKPIASIYFWAVTLVLLVAGASIYNRLRQHFADVL